MNISSLKYHLSVIWKQKTVGWDLMLTLGSKDCIGIIYDIPTQRNNSSAGQKDAQIANGGKYAVKVECLQLVIPWFRMEDDEDRTEVEGQLTAESIKLISESVGISSLNDEALNLLIDDGTYRLKQLTQVSWIELMARLCLTRL